MVHISYPPKKNLKKEKKSGPDSMLPAKGVLHFHFSPSCTGEGNGSPLQYSCLENSRDGSLVGCRLWGRTESDTTEVT